MAAPVLTPAEQRSAIGKKKKKRVLKNLLGLPTYLKVDSQTPDESEAEKLKNILERLLPAARLPIQQNFKSKESTHEETTHKENAMLKRKQLSLGVNDLNKSIKKGLISAALFANDVEPKFLIHHLNLLCRHNKIPHLHLIHLREITKNCLGFPCIALGFKTSSDFSEVINEIRTICEKKGLSASYDCELSDTDMTEGNDKVTEEKLKNDEPPFVYLYRTSTKERVFVPENENNQNKDGFISLVNSEDAKPEKVGSGISAHLIKKKNKEMVKPKEDSSSEEDYKIPRKKQKRNGFGNKMGIKQKPKYHPVNLVQVSSNPNRIGKRKKV